MEWIIRPVEAGDALLNEILDLADHWLMLVRVELEVFSDNEGAIRLYESLGFQKEGLKRMATVRGGRYVDEYLMARLRPGLEPWVLPSGKPCPQLQAVLKFPVLLQKSGAPPDEPPIHQRAENGPPPDPDKLPAPKKTKDRITAAPQLTQP